MPCTAKDARPSSCQGCEVCFWNVAFKYPITDNKAATKDNAMSPLPISP